MKIQMRPKSTAGRWAVVLVIAFFLFFALFQLLVAVGQRGGETFFSNLALTIPILLAGSCGVTAFVTGMVGVIKSRERSILVYFAILIGLFVLMFVLGEIIFPH